MLRSPLWVQNDTYSAQNDRSLIDAVLTTGVCAPGDLVVAPRALGANMSVDIATGSVVCPGISGPYICVSDAIENRTIAAAPGSGSRIDLVVATVRDSAATGSGSNYDWILQVITGTASGTPAVPSTPAYSTVLARVTVPSGTASITSPRITDYRTAATAPGDRWTSLPPQGRNGQTLATSDGKAWVYLNGWKNLITTGAIDYDYGNPVDTTTATGVHSTWGQLTLPSHNRAVLVEGTVVGTVVASTGTCNAGYGIRISTDNGSTWTTAPGKNALSDSALATVPFSDQLLVASPGTQDAIIQARIWCNSGSARFIDGSILCKAIPV